ncbi:MAG: hypothetical protein ACOYMN_10535 [Roseimicrobium sp.]
MNTTQPPYSAWSRLSRLAARAPEPVAEVPFGFATRVVASWQADRRERALVAFEWLTLRGLAVAALIFASSAAFGYDTVAGLLEGEASLVGAGLLDIFPTLL